MLRGQLPGHVGSLLSGNLFSGTLIGFRSPRYSDISADRGQLRVTKLSVCHISTASLKYAACRRPEVLAASRSQSRFCHDLARRSDHHMGSTNPLMRRSPLTSRVLDLIPMTLLFPQATSSRRRHKDAPSSTNPQEARDTFLREGYIQMSNRITARTAGRSARLSSSSSLQACLQASFFLFAMHRDIQIHISILVSDRWDLPKPHPSPQQRSQFASCSQL